MSARQTTATRRSEVLARGAVIRVETASQKPHALCSTAFQTGVRTSILFRHLQVALLTWIVCAQGLVALGESEEKESKAVAKVVSIRTSVKGNRSSAGLDDTIYVTVDNLDALLKQQPIKLYLNGRPAPVPEPQVTRCKKGKGELGFRLTAGKADTDHEYWKELLPPVKGFTKEVQVSVGPASGAMDGDVKLTLIVIRPRSFWIWLSLFVILVSSVVYLGKKTTMLRESAAPLGGGDKKTNAYSLARTQLAFWFVLILSSFGFIWLVTGQLNTLTSSVVALAGISAATALGAVTIDASTEHKAKTDLLAKQQALQSAVDSSAKTAAKKQVSAAENAAQQQQAEQQSQLGTEIAALEKMSTAPASESFLLDILTDANGISLHRLQIFLWTIALGVIFVEQVLEYLSMPEFSETLLALMGISSGTYLGFKFPEQKQ